MCCLEEVHPEYDEIVKTSHWSTLANMKTVSESCNEECSQTEITESRGDATKHCILTSSKQCVVRKYPPLTHSKRKLFCNQVCPYLTVSLWSETILTDIGCGHMVNTRVSLTMKCQVSYGHIMSHLTPGPDLLLHTCLLTHSTCFTCLTALMMMLVELMMNVFVFLADDGLECGTVISTDSSVAQVDSVLRCQTSQHQHSLQHRQHQGATHWGHSTLTTVCVYHEIIDILNHQCLWVTRIVSADAAQHISSSLVFRQNTNNIRFSATGAQLLSHHQPVQSLTPLYQDLYQHVE